MGNFVAQMKLQMCGGFRCWSHGFRVGFQTKTFTHLGSATPHPTWLITGNLPSANAP